MSETTILTNATRPRATHGADHDVVHFASLLAMPVPVPPRRRVAPSPRARLAGLALVLIVFFFVALATGILWAQLLHAPITA